LNIYDFLGVPLARGYATSLGSGCYGLRYRFGNPRLIVIANEVKQSQKNYKSPKRDCFGLRPRNNDLK
jgi:hypothetical protein